MSKFCFFICISIPIFAGLIFQTQRRHTAPYVEPGNLSGLPSKSPNPAVKVTEVAYLIMQRTDLDTAEQFFNDFGLITHYRDSSILLMRGASSIHHCVEIHKSDENKVIGMGFLLGRTKETLPELNNLVGIKGASQVMEFKKETGGGYGVVLYDPYGWRIEVRVDMAEVEALPHLLGPPVSPTLNLARQKLRPVNTVQRHATNLKGPPKIWRLGHVVRSTAKALETIKWYQDTLGLIISDMEFLHKDPNPLIAFLRVDRGEIPADHHTVAIASVIHVGLDHAAFEVQDLDAVGACNTWLNQQGKYKHAWGIGRHTFGSQIFDYWRDPFGDMFEHYADGDLFTSDYPTGYYAANLTAQHQWGPPYTATFKGLDNPRTFVEAIRHLWAGDSDLTVSRILKLIQL